MSKLKEARTSANLNQTDVLPVIKSIEPHFDVSLLSKVENGVCLPTAQVSDVMCRMYGMNPSDIYEPQEVDFKVKKAKGKKHPCDENVYKFTVRIPLKYIGSPNNFHRVLNLLGFEGPTEWAIAKIKDLQVYLRGQS